MGLFLKVTETWGTMKIVQISWRRSLTWRIGMAHAYKLFLKHAVEMNNIKLKHLFWPLQNSFISVLTKTHYQKAIAIEYQLSLKITAIQFVCQTKRFMWPSERLEVWTVNNHRHLLLLDSNRRVKVRILI